jgi:hypothetical protein
LASALLAGTGSAIPAGDAVAEPMGNCPHSHGDHGRPQWRPAPSTAVPTVATVLFFSAQPVRARLAAEIFNAAADPAVVRAIAADDDVSTEQARAATLQVTLGMRRAEAHASQPAGTRSEQWPLLEALGELGQPLDVPAERVRQHVLDLVRRQGWSPRR